MSIPNDTNFTKRRFLTAALRKKLLEQHSYKCAICGVHNDLVPLEIASLTPRGEFVGTESELEFTVLCPNCHRQLDYSPRDTEFARFLEELLALSGEFARVTPEEVVGSERRHRVDLLATRKDGLAVDDLLIEIKARIPSGALSEVIKQILAVRAAHGVGTPVIATGTTVPRKAIMQALQAGVEIWDLVALRRKFGAVIPSASPSFFRNLLLAHLTRPAGQTEVEKLLARLDACQPGKKDWSLFQSLVGDILAFLFSPPLGTPIPELGDKSGANRRDFIMPNYVDSGFWNFVRERYRADYIVVDAKNYTRRVKKSEVLQIANYLKIHGAGLFGIIVARVGGDSSGCEHTIREQWLVHQKMILILDDDALRAMLAAKADGQPPEAVLGDAIERFRLSM